MYFKNIFRDNHSPISLTEIQGRSEIASYFESSAPKLCKKVEGGEMLR